MKVFITQRCLSEGVIEVEANQNNSSPNMIMYGEKGLGRQYCHGEGVNWHLTKEKALERAEVMRLKKIRSLQASIEKLRALTFK